MPHNVTLHIGDMYCQSCAARLERLLARAPGVRNVAVDFATGAVDLRYNTQIIGPDRLRALIERGGFRVAENR